MSEEMYASQLASYNDSMEQMGLEYGRGSKIDASYLYDQIKPVTMTNRGGVLAPVLAVAGGSYLLGEDQVLGSMNNGMKNAYDGMQTIYGNALDNGMNSVIDFFNPKPDMMANGPLSRNTKRTPSLNRVRASLGDNEVMPLAEQRYLAEMDYNNSPLTEAEMGSSPVQETDTGPGLMMSSGPMSRNGYRHYPGGYNIPANASLTQEAQEARDYQGFNGRAGHPHTRANFPDRPEFSKEYHTASIDNTPSHLIPGYNRMVNEGYDSDQGVQTDWAAKWRASSKPQEK